MIRRNTKRRFASAVLGVALAAALAACGDGSGTSAGEKLDDSELEKFAQIAEDAQAEVTDFVGPTEEFAPR